MYFEILLITFSILEIFTLQFLTFCKTLIMDANEYEAIRGYLLTNVIPPEIKSDRYKKKNFFPGSARDLPSRQQADEGLS